MILDMPRILALSVVLLAACSGGGGDLDQSSPKYGCATAENAFLAYDESVKGATDGTSTPADLAKLMGTVHDKMDSVATIANGELKQHATSAALSAGRIRVALDGGGSDVKAEAASLRTEMHAASKLCHS